MAVPAKGYTSLIPPEAGQTFTAGQIININIPCGRFGEYLRASESDLRFKINNSGAAAGGGVNNAVLSGGAWAVIEKIEVFHGANLLSSIDDYGSLHNAIYDMTVSSNYRQGIGSICHGTSNVDLGTSTATLRLAQAPLILSRPFEIEPEAPRRCLKRLFHTLS